MRIFSAFVAIAILASVWFALEVGRLALADQWSPKARGAYTPAAVVVAVAIAAGCYWGMTREAGKRKAK